MFSRKQQPISIYNVPSESVSISGRFFGDDKNVFVLDNIQGRGTKLDFKNGTLVKAEEPDPSKLPEQDKLLTMLSATPKILTKGDPLLQETEQPAAPVQAASPVQPATPTSTEPATPSMFSKIGTGFSNLMKPKTVTQPATENPLNAAAVTGGTRRFRRGNRKTHTKRQSRQFRQSKKQKR